MKAFDHPPVRGSWRFVTGPADVAALVDAGATRVVAVIRDPGATFLRPVYDDLAAVVCTTGTPRSHIGIVARGLQVPCVVAASFPDGLPEDGTEVEIDCSGDDGVVRA